ncbi:MAG TPA: DNA polymerase III subunit chi [Methylophilaceae bacterium]|jgi:DNA polymerase-3 subunit chi|nr:DNA polymerase III subunit chi [Methylophilaceae bacterium]
MTRIDFYFNVMDKFRQVAELAHHALNRQRRLFIYTTDVKAAAALESALWSQPPTGFLPHCRSDHALGPETPIIIDWQGQNLLHDDILINLTPEHPPFFSRFKGLIEVVGVEEDDRSNARSRFRFYRERGYEIKSHDVAGQ